MRWLSGGPSRLQGVQTYFRHCRAGETTVEIGDDPYAWLRTAYGTHVFPD